MKIAFFGGSFDPPHTGHDSIVKNAIRNLDIDKLIIMPTFINPFKNSFCAPPKMRYGWAKKLWQNYEKVEVSDFEINHNRPVPTIESVKAIYKKYDIEKFYLILGADHLEKLHLWDGFDELCNLVEFVIASRNNIKIPDNLSKMNIKVNISSSQIRQNLKTDKIPAVLKNEIINFYKGIKMKRIENITKILDEKKAENIEVIDMQDKDYIAKFVIIATTLAPRHAYSLIDDLKNTLQEQFLNIESTDDWSVIDMGDILIHLMSEEHRQKYNIEDFLAKLKKNEI